MLTIDFFFVVTAIVCFCNAIDNLLDAIFMVLCEKDASDNTNKCIMWSLMTFCSVQYAFPEYFLNFED